MAETDTTATSPEGKLPKRKVNPLAAVLAGEGPSRRQRLLLALAVLAAVALPYALRGGDRWITLFTIVIIWAVLASGLNIVVGFTGLLDLGYVAFFAIGGYYWAIVTVQVLQNHFGLDLTQLWWIGWINLILAGIIASAAGAVLGYPTLRLRGDYLAIMTLGFGEIIRITATNWVGLTRGPSGIRGIPNPAIGGFVFNSSMRLYYLALVLALVSLFIISRMVRSRVGRAWTAIREDEIAAEAMGIHTSRYKLLSYASGGFFGGLMGAFFAQYIQFIHPSNFKLLESIVILSLVVLGGMGSIAGPVIGAVIWIGTQEWLRDVPFVQAHPEVRGIAMGLILVVLMIVRPQGLLGSRRVALEMRPGSRTELAHEEQSLFDTRDEV